MVHLASPQDVKSWLSDPQEIAFLDVREHGQYGEAHPFFALPAPYSTFERRVVNIAPNPAVRMVLIDAGDGLSDLAAKRAEALGYQSVTVMDGGAPAWAAAGYTLFAGVNVPSKTFGELLELARHTPRLTADEVRDMQSSGTVHVIVDGRPFSEYTKFSIPGGICCPNGELALRIGDLVTDPDTPIVVNCAGRTRSILGAQTLIDAGVSNPVYALENGTQGWFLAGLELDRGAQRIYPQERGDADLTEREERAKQRAVKAGAAFVSAERAADMLGDESRTTYLMDVRTAEEYDSDGLPGSIHAPGGQLVQAT
ncbi:MAG: rhodanese-like domain-containing protein, partial [Hyphomicrobiaceae bacterium]